MRRRTLPQPVQWPRLFISSCPRSTPSSWCLEMMGSSSRVCPPCKPFSSSGRWSGARWRRAPGPTRHWLAPARRCPWEQCTTAQRTDICCGHVTVAYPPCRSCDGGGRSSRVWQYRPTPVSSVGGRRRTLATCASCVHETRRWHDSCAGVWWSSRRSFP